ncbi:hypothetical protein CYMTET_18671 [Cymbomonas tetramitiformis]|uniref:Reverse transcriptase n=1 Tax=Cymbomonas tetramitiformis TaxID=36881 RepID=A0AAE0G866_9CHLO|nr:hypothetical protein CYMTET_18671 [Cymbomonas tetramitiformis]
MTEDLYIKLRRENERLKLENSKLAHSYRTLQDERADFLGSWLHSATPAHLTPGERRAINDFTPDRSLPGGPSDSFLSPAKSQPEVVVLGSPLACPATAPAASRTVSVGGHAFGPKDVESTPTRRRPEAECSLEDVGSMSTKCDNSARRLLSRLEAEACATPALRLQALGLDESSMVSRSCLEPKIHFKNLAEEVAVTFALQKPLLNKYLDDAVQTTAAALQEPEPCTPATGAETGTNLRGHCGEGSPLWQKGDARGTPPTTHSSQVTPGGSLRAQCWVEQQLRGILSGDADPGERIAHSNVSTQVCLSVCCHVVRGGEPRTGPRGPGDHDGFLCRRGGGQRVGVKTVDGWSREAEKGLLMGWRRLPRGDAGAGAGGEPEGVSGEDGATGVDPLANGMIWQMIWHPDASGLLLSAARVRGGSGARGNPRAAGQTQGQHGGAGLVGDPDELGEAGWTWLRGLRVDECAVSDFPSLMVPKKLWGLFTECVMVALRRMRVDTEDVEACKLFFLLPRLVLQPVQQGVKQGVAQVIKERCARFLRMWEWEGLHAEVPGDQRAVAEAGEERVLRDAVRLVKAGQLGKAAKRLELAKLAPATEETLLKLERLHPAVTGRRQDVGEDRRRELREQALELDEKTFDDVMRNLPRASGPGSSQWRWEHMWTVHVSGGRDALLEVCNHLAAGRAPAGVREWLAGARLVALLKDDLGVNVRPIACGEVLRKLVAKVICRQRAKAIKARFYGRRQDDEHGGLRAAHIGVAVKGGADLGVHTVQAALDRHPEWVCVKADARNAFNEERHPSVVIFAYLDDAFFLGPPVEAALAYETYMEEAVAIGLDIQPVKSAAFSPEGDASCFEAGMPGARGELDFIDVLGVPVGKAEAVSVEMLKKVEELCGILPLLNKLGHAQAQGLLLRFCAHPRLGFWLRGVPPEMMREAAEEHDRRMQGALRDLLPGGGLAWHSCEFATLPHGMGLTKAARVSSAAWLGGFAQVWEDMRELFPTVTAGTEDLGAESDLPYANSLQAAMQKVSEAMEVIGEARGAHEHLPPQAPKADDVKKLSDYSRSQKRAQRVYAAVLHSADWLWLAGHVGASRLPWLFLVEECPDCGGERDPTGTHLLACRGGAGAGGGNWYSFIHHKLQRVLFEMAKSAYPLASALHDDFAGYLTYSRNHYPDVTVLDAEGPGQHVLFDVATARPKSDAHLGAAMMAPGAAAKKVEESKVATYGDVRPHHFIPFGVEVYGGLGPAAYGFLWKTQRRFRERRYMEANAEGGEQLDGNGDEDEDEDEEAARGGAVGWKEKWVRLFSFALARGVAGLIIRRVVGRCPAGSGWRWAGGGRVRGGMGPDLDRGEADRREGAERLALMDRAWEDAFEETDYATQDGSGGGMQESEGTQRERSG